jgi:heptosyltransferase-3
MRATDTERFWERTRDARKVMVLDLGFLGDTVHLLPALWKIRQAYPEAKLHVAVASHITSLMDCVPWVDHTWGYMRYPRHATLKENWQMISQLRREKFDVVINLNGSDRSSWLTFLSGARERLGRIPNDGGPIFWKQMFTAYVQHPSGQEPIYEQSCRCLEQAGFPMTQPEFHAIVSPTLLHQAELSEADTGNYFHISPFTTADRRELSPAKLAGFIHALRQTFPKRKIVVSCAPTERERLKLKELLALMPEQPWRVYAGTLNLPQLAAVIQHSALHFSGDTGTLHLAVMTRTPSVVWFWPNPGAQHLRHWVPSGKDFRILFGAYETGTDYLSRITPADLVQAAQSILADRVNPACGLSSEN